jgi:hypothetical protein
LISITGIEFALAAQPKNLPMHQPLENLEIKVLEKMYLRQTKTLKYKLLSGSLWKNLLKEKNKVLELALAIHKKQFIKDSFIPVNFSLEKIED